MGLKNILKNTVKAAVTVAVPPVGLALWPKDKKNKVTAGMIGAVVSGAISLGYLIKNTKTLNETPPVRSLSSPDSRLAMLGTAITSPLLFYHFSNNEVNITIDNTLYRAHNHKNTEPISFSNGKYQLNFDENTVFGANFYRKCLVERKADVQKYKKELACYVGRGDLLNAERTSTKLESARATLRSTQNDYDSIRKIFETEVERLNSKLEALASQPAER